MTRSKRRSPSPHRSEKKRSHAAATTAGRGGRPSHAEAEKLGERILDVASELFFAHGYGATSIEAVARRAGISKRTFYHRYAGKSALFSAVIHRFIERLRPPTGVPIFKGADLREILERLAGLILRAALSPPAVALHRLIVGESGRFPKLAAAVNREGANENAIRLIAGVLERELAREGFVLNNPRFAAEQFLYMVIAVPQRRAAGLGAPMTAAEVDAWGRNVVELFLDGCRGTERSLDNRSVESIRSPAG
jgi:TetR/AcrR family transcriptional repressor of mexJK operon